MLKFKHGVFQIVHVAESGGMQMISNGQQCSDLPSLYHRIGFIQRPTFKAIRTIYRGIDVCHARPNKVSAHAQDDPPCRCHEVGKPTSYVLNQAWSRVWCSICNVVGVPSKLCIWNLNTSHTTVPINIFRPHAVYTGSSDRPRLPYAVFCDDAHICGLLECIYIIPLTDNEGYVFAMNGFLLVQMSVNQISSSCIVRIPSQMLGLLGSTYIKPCIRISSLTTLPSWLLSVLRGRHHI